jgi:DNA-binding MarR family transcriptional regulator
VAIPPEPPVAEPLIEAFEARLREVELVVGARIMHAWADSARLSLEEARVLLALAAIRCPTPARQLAQLSGLAVAEIYPVPRRLAQYGLTHEEGRRYQLTDRGDESIAALAAARREGIAAYVGQLDAEERARLAQALGVTA